MMVAAGARGEIMANRADFEGNLRRQHDGRKSMNDDKMKKVKRQRSSGMSPVMVV